MRESRESAVILLLSLCMLSPWPALAAYKCNVAGTVSYSDQPCPDGQSINIDTATVARNQSAEQAVRQSEQEKRQLRQLENERRKREAQEEKERQREAHVQAAKRKRCSLLEHRRTWAEEDLAAATGRSVEKAKLKARRVGEQYEEECGSAKGMLGLGG